LRKENVQLKEVVAEMSFGKWIEEEKWNLGSGKVRGYNDEAKSINIHLDGVRINLNKIYDKLIDDDKLPAASAS
jgi:hypothetical protein